MARSTPLRHVDKTEEAARKFHDVVETHLSQLSDEDQKARLDAVEAFLKKNAARAGAPSKR